MTQPLPPEAEQAALRQAEVFLDGRTGGFFSLVQALFFGNETPRTLLPGPVFDRLWLRNGRVPAWTTEALGHWTCAELEARVDLLPLGLGWRWAGKDLDGGIVRTAFDAWSAVSDAWNAAHPEVAPESGP